MITALYAGILGLIFVVLTALVIKGRFQHETSFGDGGVEGLTRRIRTHGNFAEYVPFALVLMMLAEMQNAPIWALHVSGILLIAGRLLHIKGMLCANAPLFFRVGGMVLTLLVLFLGAAWCLWIAAARWIIGY